MLEDGSRALSSSSSDRLVEEPRCCFPPRPVNDSKMFCCRCAHSRRASPLTCLAICFLVLTYNLLGGFLFLAIEGSGAQETAVAAVKPNLRQPQEATAELRSRAVERLWSITEDLNILYKENWTKLAAKELMDFQKDLFKSMKGEVVFGSRVSLEPEDHRWTFSNSILYALTLITTIGQDNITPKSSVGKVVAIAYACIGIPIIMMYLSTIGEALARRLRELYGRACPASLRAAAGHARADCPQPTTVPTAVTAHTSTASTPRTPFQAALNLDNLVGGYHWTCSAHTRVPVPLSVLLLALYVALGAAVFRATEGWSLADGCYFSFSSLATIGFGDLRPGLRASRVSAAAEDTALAACCAYILVGIAFVAMCFNLIQEDASLALRRLTALCAGGGKPRAVHSAERMANEKAALSVVT